MLGIVKGDKLSSSEYHSMKGTYSSSQLKTILEDPELFYEKYVNPKNKNEEQESISAFDIGTYFHTAILEPHKLQEETAIYPKIRRGKDWEAFKELHKDKAIITSAELVQAETIVKAVKKSEIANLYLKDSESEVSAFAELFVYKGFIYSNGRVLTITGWGARNEAGFELARSFGIKLVLKVRADALGKDFILDLKSTTGNVKNKHLMKTKVSAYSYDLSASLYLDIFTIVTGVRYEKFILCFASKDYGNCQNYILSEKSKKIGRSKYMKAIILLADCIKNDWKFEETLENLEPQFFENEWLDVSEEYDL